MNEALGTKATREDVERAFGVASDVAGHVEDGAKAWDQTEDAARAKRFAITHFFNPPRYMQLLELVTSDNTDKDVVDALRQTTDVLWPGGDALTTLAAAAQARAGQHGAATIARAAAALAKDRK